MRNLLLILFVCFISFSSSAYDWGKKGHRTTAAIADQYLSRKAKKNIASILGDETLVTASTYADEIKSYSEYRKYSSWHYVNIAPGENYESSHKNESGDILTAIAKCKEVLQSDTSSKQDKIFYLKFLVHLVGDLHQPLHCGHAEDKGGNDIQVRWFNDGTNLHSVWDTKMIESYGMSYSELAENTAPLKKRKYKELSQGSALDWMQESRALAEQVYSSAEIGEKLGYRYSADNLDLVFQQLEKGGIRLAALLNELLG